MSKRISKDRKKKPLIRKKMDLTEYVSAEVALKPMTSNYKVLEGNEWVVASNVKNYVPSKENIGATVKGLSDAGFHVLGIGTASITIGANVDLFEKQCQVQLEKKTKLIFRSESSRAKSTKGRVSFYGAPKDQNILSAPENVKQFVEGIVIPEQPMYFVSAFPPNLSPPYHNLHPVGDVPMLIQANRLHAEGHLGKGVKLAICDTGFYTDHPYYTNRGYNISTMGEPTPGTTPDTDEYGHGTGITSNALAVAPAVNLLSVKQGTDPALAFKLAVRQRPNIISNSWGYDIDSSPNLPVDLIPLEIEVANAVANGITVLFAAGNGQKSWPAGMSDVIAVGGGYFDENLNLQASSYASSFDSSIYPGRHVPDVCGLTGLAPRGIYIEMPTQPGSHVDQIFSGGAFPNGDETTDNDGWLCASGTSSATPMVAAVVALLLEKKPSLTPDEIKQILMTTARDIDAGVTSMGDPAGPGWDAATGYGLVNAYEAWKSIP
jgi:serine protease AprX